MRAARRVLRIALGDLRTHLSRGAFWLAALGPALLVLLIGGLIGLTAVVLSLVQVANPDVRPMGNSTVAVVGLSELPASSQAHVRALIADAQALERDDRGTLGWVARGKTYVAALRGTGGQVAEAPRDPVQWQLLSLGPDQARALVPDAYDAALLLKPDGDGISYEIVADGAILYSRIMERRIGSVIDAYARGQGAPSSLRVTDHLDPKPDRWAVHVLLALIALGAAYTYHGVAVQSVASVLAGERDRRTLEVLLSLPLSARELVWGKLLALVSAILVPTTLWTLLGVWAVHTGLGVMGSAPRLLLLGATVILPLTAVGCAISATAPTSQAAQNRLGLANLGVFVATIVGLYMLDAVGLGGTALVSGVVAMLSGAPGGWAWALALVGLSVGLSAALVEVSARFMRPTP